MDLLPEIDLAFYRRYDDLAQLEPRDLVRHFEVHGAAEGRAASAAAYRETFLEYPERARSVLEIGPFCNPCILGTNVKYFDVLSSADLKSRAEKIGYPIVFVPDVAFVSPNGDLEVVNDTFSAVVSSHSIEHQPDLIKHLSDVCALLEPGGRYFLIVPDKRYCFDHCLPDSTVADIIEAHIEQRRTHRLGNVIEHRALTTHNDAARHWQGDHLDRDYADNIAPRTQQALREFKDAGGAYIDVHAWKFTPEVFRLVMTQLAELGLIDLVTERVYQTPHGRNEFTAVLRKMAI